MQRIQPHATPANKAGAARWYFRIAVAVGALLALALWVDADLALFIHAHQTVALRQLALDVSELADAGLYAGLAVSLYVGSLIGLSMPFAPSWRLLQERLARASLVVVLTLLSGGLTTLLMKHVVARARPALLVQEDFYGIAEPFAGSPFNSFPSSHAFTAFAVVFALWRILPAWRTPLLAVACAVAMSRLLLLEHFLSDVLASALIAGGWARLWSARILGRRAAWALRMPWRWGKA